MKRLIAALFALALAAPAFAEQPSALVIDPDKAGTNVRDAPSGRVVDVIPYASATSPDAVKQRRVVKLLSNEGKWFKVAYSGGEGYLHQSTLGVCVTSTEEGDAPLRKSPGWDAAVLGYVPDDTLARPLAFFMKDDDPFLNVEILEGPRKGMTGWIVSAYYTVNPDYGRCFRRR